MTTLSGRNEFAPPPTPGFLRSLGLAILAHGVLVAMLTVGVQWKRDTTAATFEAELWSVLPQEAAPPAPEPEPPQPPQPPIPAEPVVAPKPVPTPVHTPNADIVLAKEKAKRLKEKELQQEKLEQEKQVKLKQEQKAQGAKDAAADKKKAAAKAKAETQKLEELRQQNLKRMAGMAGGPTGNGNEQSRGTAAQSSGPSASYAGRIVERVLANTRIPVHGLSVKIFVRTAPNGTILDSKVVRSSGNSALDDAVIRGLERMGTLPKDTDGKIPEILFREGLELDVKL